MPDMMRILACLSQCLDTTTLRQLSRVTEAMLSMTGRVTMRGCPAGPAKGADRTIQRFFITSINWATLQWVLIRHRSCWSQMMLIWIGGDDVVVTNAGKHTYGLDRFFSSLYGKMVRGLGFLSVSLMSVKRRTSYPVMLEQLAQQHPDHPREVGKKKSQGKNGRPDRAKNQHRRDVTSSP